MEDSPTIKAYPNGERIVISTYDHALYLSTRLRPYDILECHANNLTPLEALMMGIDLGNETYTVLNSSNLPVAMFGTGRSNGGVGDPYIWLLGSDGMKNVSLRFLRECKGIIQWLVEPYGKAYNYVFAGYKTTIKWLLWCGASFIEEVEIRGVRFFKFVITSI